MDHKNYSATLNFGYYTSQGVCHYGYKLHAICGLNDVIHSYDLTRASVHDINYLHDVKLAYHDCSIFGDRGYSGKEIQLDLFETANIKLECPYRLNQNTGIHNLFHLQKHEKELKWFFLSLLIKIYTKDTDGLFAKIIREISAFNILQYINKKNNNLIG